MNFRLMVSALGIVLVSSSFAAAQAPAPAPAGGGQRAGGAPPAPMKNLQVLPKDGKCPSGYDPVLNLLGIVVLCTLHQ